MTLSTTHRHALRPRAGAAARTLFLGGLILASAAALVGGRPAQAQAMAAERSTGQVARPSPIRNSTAMVASDARRSAYTNPLDHLPARDRAGTGGRGE